MKAITNKGKRLVPLYDKVDEVFYHYDKYKGIIQKNMVKKGAVLEEEKLLDHHKIAAAFCCSVMKTRPINYVPGGSGVAPSQIEKTANEQCAYLLGLQVVQNFWAAKGDDNISAEDKEVFNKSIVTPKPDSGNIFYNDCFAELLDEKTFKHLDYENSKFGETLIFFIAHIYFMLESYSYQYYKNNE